MRRVVLVGNGISTAANGGFRLGPLTTSVQARLDAMQIGARTAREHLELTRDRLEADGHQDPNGSTFERLLGPLDRLSGLMSVELAAVIGSVRPDLLDPLKEVGDLVRALYVRGVGAVLSEIDALDAAANLDPVREVVRWTTAGLGNYDHLSVYTVNYDPLLDRELLASQTEVVQGVVTARYVLADEFSGLDEDASTITLAAGTNPVTAFAPRSEPYGRLRAVDLVHLHGGQHWIRTASGLVYKAPLADLRAADAYGRWTRGDPIAVQPAVVLTDQKSVAVLQGPFVDAYARLRHDLTRAHRVWGLIAELADDPDPGGEDPGRVQDAVTHGINSVRGRAIETAVQYALWVARGLRDADPGQTISFSRIPEVAALLEAHLDPARERSLGVRAILGLAIPQLAALDERWLADHVDALFALPAG